MPNYYTGNRWLTLAEQKINANYLRSLLEAEGWTLHAIAGLLGNTQTESTSNPGIWQNLNPSNPKLGYGLTQWTPSTKYTNWCAQNGLTPSAMESAVARLKFEVDNPSEQWVVHESLGYPLTFKQFTQSEESPYYLGMTFLNNYEMPGDLNQPKRGKQAEFWYEFLSGEAPPDPPGPGPDRNTYKNGNTILISILKGGQRFGSFKQR